MSVALHTFQILAGQNAHVGHEYLNTPIRVRELFKGKAD
jgi:hypothetical protein